MASADIKNNSNKSIISVGIIGCSNHCLSKQWVCKQLVSNQITNSVADDTGFLNDPFEWMRGLQSGAKPDRCSQKSMLYVYDDIESGTIYFNLKSHTNLKQLSQLLKRLCAQKSKYEFHRILQSTENTYIKSLIFLFLCCHHILLFCESPRFNPQWLSIFRFLQEMKIKLISPIIDVLQPIFGHIIGDKDNKEGVMSYLSNHNLSPFIIPVLTFFYPSPNTNGYIVFDDRYSKQLSLEKEKGALLHKAVVRKFAVRLQQQIAVLLRRCHAVFPYFQTQHNDNDIDNDSCSDKKYSSLSHKELFECIDELRDLGFDISCYLDSEIYSTHSRWIETDDMMHNNPLSLFCLLPNRFISIYGDDLVSSICFLFNIKLNVINNDSLSVISNTNGDIVSYLVSGSKSMPSRMHFYVSSKEVYDSIFKSLSEDNSSNRIYNLFNYDITKKRKNKKFYNIQNKNKMCINLDIDRLGRYSSLLCRRAYKCARCSYLRDLPEMYPFSLHCLHIKLAMKVFRQQSIGPFQSYYCRQLYFELSFIYKTGGREACHHVSLTGRPCCRPVHDGKNINLCAMKKNESAKFAEERHSKFGQDPSGHFSGFSSCHSCNCGRTISKREDPFDLFCANNGYFNAKCCLRVQWNYKLYCKSDDAADDKADDIAHHYNDGFNLCNHGGAELYHKQTGITQPGFDRYNCFLLRWDIPIPSNVYIFHQHYKQKNQRYRDNYYNKKYNQKYHQKYHIKYDQNDENLGLWIHKIRKTVSIAKNKAKCNAYFPCFVGLEFECYRGHRGILDLNEISSFDHYWHYQSKFDDEEDKEDNENNQQMRFVGTEFPTQNVPLRMPCKQCYLLKTNANNIINGQLQRAFIVTPPPPISITIKPIIVSAASDAIFEFDTPVVLPPSSFLVLRFPYIYYHDGRGLPPDKLSLKRAMLTVANNYNGIQYNQQTKIINKKITIKHKKDKKDS